METCCIEKVGKFQNSSCPMILRSACYHKHSHKSFIHSDVQFVQSTPQKRKSIGSHSDGKYIEKTVTYDSLANSTFKSISVQSKSVSENDKNLSYKSLSISSDMSRTRTVDRSRRNSARVFSGSESEGEALNSSNHRQATVTSAHQCPNFDIHLLSSASNHVNSSRYQRHPSPIDSIFDKFRWFLWRYVYLKIISGISFDVWFLSRLRDSRKKAVLIITLPLLIYLLYYGFSQSDTSSTFTTVMSSLFSIISYPYYTFYDLAHGEQSCSVSFSKIPSFFSKFFVSEESSSHVHKATPHHQRPQPTAQPVKPASHSLDEDQIKSLALGVVEERFGVLFNQLKSDVRKEVENACNRRTPEQDALLASLNQKMNRFEQKMYGFEEDLASLSTLKKDLNSPEFVASIEKHIVSAFKSVVTRKKSGSLDVSFFNEWLNERLSTEVNAALEKVKKDQSSTRLDQNSLGVVKSVVEHYVESLRSNLSTFRGTGAVYGTDLTREETQRIIKEAIMLYDADKIGKVDYALESGGGSVLGTRCSESYNEKKGKYTVFGWHLWSVENTPRTAIQPDVHPGKCWAFKGSQGFLVIKLSYTILPTGFTMEHIPLSLSPSGSIDSAPKDFSVYGLSSEVDEGGTLLGKYTYDIDGEPLQYFPVQIIGPDPYSYVELQISSNHGNIDYTCLYRFRIHGKRVS